jgi:transcriptional regulator with XRE-family HTH domain
MVFLMGKVYCKFHKTRVRAAREALKLTKAELARRAMLTAAQYAYFEPAPRDRTHGTCTYIPREWVLRMATALGVTPEFLATGATSAKVLPPNDPRKALLGEVEKERKRTARWQRIPRRHDRRSRACGEGRTDAAGSRVRNTYPGVYPGSWPQIALQVKDAAHWRCVRCNHPFDAATGAALPCTSACDPERGLHRRFGIMSDVQFAENVEWLLRLNYGVHHFDGDKDNNRWWNLMALCNSCHLKIQSSVIPERVWLFEHSEWARPYIGGFYAWWHAQLLPTRELVESDPTLYLAMGQPWLYPERAEAARREITAAVLDAAGVKAVR